MMTKRTICILLSIMLVFGMTAVSAGAESGEGPVGVRPASVSAEADGVFQPDQEEAVAEGLSEEPKPAEEETKVLETAAAGEEQTDDFGIDWTSIDGGISAGEDLPEDIRQATETFSADMAKFSEFVDASKLTQLIQRFGGVASAASGCITVLEFFGIIEDPKMAGLDNVLQEVLNIQEQLEEMKVELDKITTMLISLAVKEEERARQQDAQNLLSYWRIFNTSYIDPLNDMVKEYQTMINTAMGDWWESAEHEGIWVVYTTYDNEKSLTYSRNTYQEGLPDRADNGEAVLKTESFGIPSEYMPATSQESFSVDHYTERLKALAAEAILTAANEKKLVASKSFYENWEAMSDEEKKTAADAYGEDFRNTVIYHVSCKKMSENSVWVTDVINAYNEYCQNINVTDSGINALLGVMYRTHGFEGEVKKDIIDLCDSMAASAGFYGMFALSVAGQDKYQTADVKQALKQTWADTVNSLDAKKKTALTGKDNYCYAAMGIVDFTEMSLQSGMKVYYTYTGKEQDDTTHQAYKGFSADSWKIVDANGQEAELPSFLNDVYAIVLYHQFQAQKPEGGDQTFNAYLNECGVSMPSDFREMIMTDFGGIENFSLADALPMQAEKLIGSYFKTGNTYNIDKGTGRKVKGKNYVLHDKVVYDCLDPATGENLVNQVCAARAAYCESHWFWWTDEAHFFFEKGGMKVDRDREEKYAGTGPYWYVTASASISVPIYMLSVSPVTKEEIQEGSPLLTLYEAYSTEALEEEENAQEETPADWSALNVQVTKTYDADDERIDEGIHGQIETAVSSAESNGLTVVLSDEEKAELAARMKDLTYRLQQELENEGAFVYLNAFGIDGDDAAELDLAAKMLSDGYLNPDGSPRILPQNMTVMALYEPGAWLRFEEKDGKTKAVIDPAFNIDPMLVFWDSKAGEFISLEIRDEIMTELGMTMTVRIPAEEAKDRSSVTVRHYSDTDFYDLLEEADLPIQGSGSDRYVVMTVDQCSPFALLLEEKEVPVTPTVTPKPTAAPAYKKTAAKTGDESEMVLWLLLCAVAAAGMAVALKKRRKEQ